VHPLVLCAIDADDRAADVLAAGRRLAATGAFAVVYVHVARVADPLPALHGHALDTAPVLAGALQESESDAWVREAREEGLSLLREAGVDDEEETVVPVGEPVAELNRLADERDAALVVVGAPDRGTIGEALLGSVSRRLAREGCRPVLVARSERLPGSGGPVVCGVERDDDATRAAAATAVSLARALDAPLVFAHVVHPPAVAVAGAGVVFPPDHSSDVLRAEREAGEQLLADIATQAGAPDAERVLLDGPPVTALDRLACGRGADVLVVGCHGRGPIRAALAGAVDRELARSAGCPIVIVPPACA